MKIKFAGVALDVIRIAETRGKKYGVAILKTEQGDYRVVELTRGYVQGSFGDVELGLAIAEYERIIKESKEVDGIKFIETKIN